MVSKKILEKHPGIRRRYCHAPWQINKKTRCLGKNKPFEMAVLKAVVAPLA